jgi:hypothetical protein
MSRRHFRALTLALLMLIVAAPLSSGDKGLWLSLAATPSQVFQTAASEVPAEHVTLVPERGSRAGRTQALLRADRVDTARIIGTVGALTSFGQGARWPLPDVPSVHPHGEPSADRPAPRAPPA